MSSLLQRTLRTLRTYRYINTRFIRTLHSHSITNISSHSKLPFLSLLALSISYLTYQTLHSDETISCTCTYKPCICFIKSQLPQLPLSPIEHSYLRKYATNSCIYRYLRACHGDVGKCMNRLIVTVKWRIENRIDEIGGEEFRDLIETGNLYVHPDFSINYQALITHKKSKLPSHTQIHFDRDKRFLIYTLERASRMLDTLPEHSHEHDAKWIWYIDMNHYSSGSAAPFAHTRSMLDILANHYPERLYRAYIIDAPSLLMWFVYLVKPFFDIRSVAKVQFVSNRHDPKTQKILNEYINNSQLDQTLGGTFIFDSEQYIRNEPKSMY